MKREILRNYFKLLLGTLLLTVIWFVSNTLKADYRTAYLDFGDYLASMEIQVVQQIGIGLVALFIPLSLIIIEEIRNKRKELQKFITEDVIKSKLFLASYLLSIVIPVFISVNEYVSPVIFVIWLFGILTILKSIINVYVWSNFPDKHIKSFLRSKKALEKTNTYDVFNSVWLNHLENHQTEQEYFLLLINLCRRIIRSRKFPFTKLTPTRLLNDYKISYTSRLDNIFPYTENSFEELLNFNYEVWLINEAWAKRKNKDKDHLLVLEFSLKELIKSIFVRSVNQKSFISIVDILLEHFDSTKETYHIRLIAYLGPELLKILVNTSEDISIESDFPGVWEISNENYSRRPRVINAWFRVLNNWLTNTLRDSDLPSKDNKIRTVFELLFDDDEVSLLPIFILMSLSILNVEQVLSEKWPLFIKTTSEFSSGEDIVKKHIETEKLRENNALLLAKRMFPYLSDSEYMEYIHRELDRLKGVKEYNRGIENITNLLNLLQGLTLQRAQN